MGGYLSSLLNNSFILYALVVILLCLIFGASIGLEREFNGFIAGLRTHILISLSFGLIGLLCIYLYKYYLSDYWGLILGGSLIALGLIACNCTVSNGKDIKGVTTTATLFITGVISLLTSFGLVFEALIVTVLTLAVLILLSYFENRTSKADPRIIIYLKSGKNISEKIVHLASKFGLQINNLASKIVLLDNSEVLQVTITLNKATYTTINTLAEELKKSLDVVRVDVKASKSYK